MEYTPGPWHRYGGMVDGYGIASKNGEIITQDAFNGLHHEANARLIATAPDLLAALEEMSAFVCGYLDHNESFLEYYDRAEQAIAKAKGEA